MMNKVTMQIVDTEEVIQPYEEYGILLVTYDAPPPPLRTFRVEIEGRNGSVDMTEWAGNTFYNDREVNMTLRDLHGGARAFVNRVAGRRLRLYFDPDYSDWYFEGRCEEISTSTRKHVTDITMRVVCHPFLYPAHGNDDYMASSSGLAYSGRRVFTLTAQTDSTGSAAKYLHQDGASAMTVTIVGMSDDVNVTVTLTVNGTDYVVQSDGVMSVTPMLRHGDNTITLSNSGNTEAVTAECAFWDRVM